MRLLEIFYTPDGKKVIEKYYAPQDKGSTLSMTCVKSNEFDDNEFEYLYSEEELFSLYLSKLLRANDIVIIDYIIGFTNAVINLSKNYRIIAVLHTLHFHYNQDPSTAPLRAEYTGILSNIDRLDAVVVSTKWQKRDLIERFNLDGKVFAYRLVL